MSHKDRKKPRSIIRFTGQIISSQEDEPVDCMVVDFSVTGARIHIEESSPLPQKFTLNIQLFPDMPLIQIKSRRVWRNRDLAGLHYEKLSRRNYSIIDNLVKIHRGELKQPEDKS
ncbi:MAG: PilZ domain-containing protein [Bdellovibrionota bacterium]